MLSRKSEPAVDPWEGVFAGAVGLWLALSLIKFGNPVILDQQIQAPSNLDELLIHSWPMAWGYALLALVLIVSCRFWQWRILPRNQNVPRTSEGRSERREVSTLSHWRDVLNSWENSCRGFSAPVPMWLLVAPLVWLGWQFVSATQTVDRALTAATLPHFVACVVAYYIGLFALARVTRLGPFWLGLVGGFVVVLMAGWKQHFGGLEETRRFFYSLADWQSYPPEFLKKVSSDRIYSTLFYPNALAGVILLLLPVSLSIVWHASRGEREQARKSAGQKAGRPAEVNSGLPAFWPAGLLVGTVGVLGLGSLYWSGSKSGWLIAMVQGSLVFLRFPIRARSKVMMLTAALSLGLGLFWLSYGDYFGRGATSVTARFDYWRAAQQTLATWPILGSGPGTFMVSYKKLKPPEAEMTRLVHNDFLQQGSDSGWPGLLAYAAWLFGAIAMLHPAPPKRFAAASRTSGVGKVGKWESGKVGAGALPPAHFLTCPLSLRLSVWLGLMGMALQSFVEFGLYIPALAWPFFLLLGWLVGGNLRLTTDPQLVNRKSAYSRVADRSNVSSKRLCGYTR